MPGQFIESQSSIVSQNHMESLKCASLVLHIWIYVITLFNEGKDIDYWSPSSFHNGPPTIKVLKCIN